jgi:hypothetical protein
MLVDQLVRELADEVALPLVAVHPVAGIEDVLLVEKGLGADPVADEPWAERRAVLLGILIRTGVAGGMVRAGVMVLSTLSWAWQLSSLPAPASTSRNVRIASGTPSPAYSSRPPRPARGDRGGTPAA